VILQDTIESEDAFESVVAADIDSEKGIAIGVKLLGLSSRNKRNYDTPGVRKTAIQRLAGSRVYINHPAKAADARDYNDKFGVVGQNVEYREGKGYFGTIYFNPQHRSASQFVWDVTNAPKTMGMSVNAKINASEAKKGEDVDVTAIESIRSVDVVNNPATTDGIFEEHIEEEEMPLTLEEIKKHPELIKSILEEHKSEATEQAELVAAKKSAKDLQDRLDAVESERTAEKLTNAVTAEFTKIFESVEIEPTLLASVIECACEMAEPQRKKLSGLLSEMSPMFIQIPDEDDEEEETPVAPAKEEVEEKPAYSPGRKPKAGSKIDLKKIMGLT